MNEILDADLYEIVPKTPCTSGSSGIGSSATDLHSLASNATWLDGQRFSGGTSRSTVEMWVNRLELASSPAA